MTLESDSISALLLTLNEPFTFRARESLEAQTLPPREVVEMAGVSPFFRAFNTGVERISTTYFLQCDSDMQLDPECLEELFRGVEDDVGVVKGLLRDPLLGEIQGVNLFRTELCRRIPLQNISHCETLQVKKFEELGWRKVVLEKSLGTHRTDLSDPIYNFERFRLAGFKSKARNQLKNLTDRLFRLRAKVDDPLVPPLIAAMLLGVSEERQSDGLTQRSNSAGLRRWTELDSDGALTRSVRARIASEEWSDWIGLVKECAHNLGATVDSNFLIRWQTYLEKKFDRHLSAG